MTQPTEEVSETPPPIMAAAETPPPPPPPPVLTNNVNVNVNLQDAETTAIATPPPTSSTSKNNNVSVTQPAATVVEDNNDTALLLTKDDDDDDFVPAPPEEEEEEEEVANKKVVVVGEKETQALEILQAPSATKEANLGGHHDKPTTTTQDIMETTTTTTTTTTTGDNDDEPMVRFNETRRSIEKASISTALCMFEEEIILPERQVMQLHHQQQLHQGPNVPTISSLDRHPARDRRLVIPKEKRMRIFAAKSIVPPPAQPQSSLPSSSPSRRKKQSARKSTGVNEMMVVDQQQQQQQRQTIPVAMNRLLLHGEMTSNYESTTLNKMTKSFAYKVRDTASEMEAMAKQATNKSKRKAAVDSTTTNGDAANNNKKAKKVKKSPNAGGETVKREAPVLVWEGEPDEPLDNNNGDGGGGGWPKGWIKRLYQRKGGSTKGLKDRYWYSPLTEKKFRSMVEIKKFMLCLKECHGDEDEAWNMFKKGGEKVTVT